MKLGRNFNLALIPKLTLNTEKFAPFSALWNGSTGTTTLERTLHFDLIFATSDLNSTQLGIHISYDPTLKCLHQKIFFINFGFLCFSSMGLLFVLLYCVYSEHSSYLSQPHNQRWCTFLSWCIFEHGKCIILARFGSFVANLHTY